MKRWLTGICSIVLATALVAAINVGSPTIADETADDGVDIFCVGCVTTPPGFCNPLQCPIIAPGESGDGTAVDDDPNNPWDSGGLDPSLTCTLLGCSLGGDEGQWCHYNCNVGSFGTVPPAR